MTTELLVVPALKYEILPMESLQVKLGPLRKGAKERTLSDLTDRCQLKVGKHDWMQSSGRFWGSVFSLFGISSSIFKYFSHREVIDRICQRRASTDLRFCMEPGGRMLAVSSPQREPITTSDLKRVLRHRTPRESKYHAGVATLTMIPKSGSVEAKIGPDSFRDEYVLDVPLDGYGGPSTYLSLLRLLCENGAVGRVPEFRSDIVIGKDDPVHALCRTLDTFAAEEGFGALRKRYQTAQVSQASVRECLSLFRLLKGVGPDATSRYEAAVGDLCGFYGMANMDELPEKKQRVLPAPKCTVYDLVNVASEVTTHVPFTDAEKANHGHRLRIEAWIGSLLREEYDLEGVETKAKDFPALFGKKRASS